MFCRHLEGNHVPFVLRRMNGAQSARQFQEPKRQIDTETYRVPFLHTQTIPSSPYEAPDNAPDDVDYMDRRPASGNPTAAHTLCPGVRASRRVHLHSVRVQYIGEYARFTLITKGSAYLARCAQSDTRIRAQPLQEAAGASRAQTQMQRVPGIPHTPTNLCTASRTAKSIYNAVRRAGVRRHRGRTSTRCRQAYRARVCSERVCERCKGQSHSFTHILNIFTYIMRHSVY